MLKTIQIVFYLGFLLTSVCECSSGYGLLKFFSGVKSTSLGENFCSVYSEPETIYYNPAGLVESQSFELRAAYLRWVADINKSDIIVSKKIRDFNFGFGINYLWTELESVSNKFSFSSYLLTLSAAKKINDNFYAGISGKMIKEDVSVESSSNLSSVVDFGVILRKQRLALGGAIQNLGVTISSTADENDVLPLLLNFSLSYITSSNSLYLFGVKYIPVDEDTTLSFGYEFGFKKTIKEQLVFRIGYVMKLGVPIIDENGLLNFRLGVGFRKEGLVIDYSLIPISFDLGFYHYIGFGLSYF
jgi:hypothetical protein